MSNREGLRLGAARPLDASREEDYHLPPAHLTTHGVVLGMTGSGKSGLLFVLVEEALRSGVPVLMVDVKGDLPNLLLAFPSFDPSLLAPWVDSAPSAGAAAGAAEPDRWIERSATSTAVSRASQRREELARWGIGEEELASYAAHTAFRVITPGSTAGEPLHVLSSLETRSARWDDDIESARASLTSAVSLLLRLVGRDADPARSREHVLLSVLAERRLGAKEPCALPLLLQDLADPPVQTVGALPIDKFYPPKERAALAASLNALLASPSFAAWRQGQSLDVGAWLSPQSGKTPGVIVSVAHLDDEERDLVLGILLEEVLTWVRAQRGTSSLRALVVFDEVYGFLPPHPANPPTKRPLVALMKQARAFGVGVVLATQNPMDLDYRALSNAGFWAVGRLQTDADRDRVVEAMAAPGGEVGKSKAELAVLVKRLAPRWFLTRDVQRGDAPFLLHPRWSMSFMRGPMTREEIRLARREMHT